MNAGEHANAVVTLGNTLRTAAERAAGTTRKPSLARIQGCTQLGAGRPGSTAATTWAAAGFRVVAGLALRCKAGGLVGATDSWWCAERNGELGFEPLWL